MVQFKARWKFSNTNASLLRIWYLVYIIFLFLIPTNRFISIYIHYCLYLFALRGFIVDDWFLSNFSWKQSTQNDSIKYKVKTLTVPKIIQMEKTVPWKLEGQSWQTISYPAAQKWRASNHQLQPISTLQGIAKIKHYMFIIPILQYTHIGCIYVELAVAILSII